MRPRLSAIIGLLLLGAICIGIEWALSNVFGNVNEATASFEDRMKRAKLLVSDPSFQFDVLVLGDSTAKEGFVPAEFSGLTGYTSFNLAISAFVAPVADIYLLEEYLRNHSPPKAVVVGRSIEFWGTDPVNQLIRQNFERVSINLFRFGRGFIAWPGFVEGLAASVVPSYQNRQYLQRYIKQMDWSDVSLWIRHPHHDVFPDGGYTGRTETLTDADPNELMKDRRAMLISKGYRPTPNNTALLTYLCRLGRQHGFPVIVFSSFHAETLDTVRDYAAALREVDAILSETARGAGCVWVSSAPAERRLLRNGTHPNLTGALVYTRQISKIVGDKLSLDFFQE